MASVKKNFAYQSIYQVVAIIIPLITSPYIARVIGAEQIGIYSYTYAIAYYFIIFALLGINNHGNKTIAAARDDFGNLCINFSELLVVHCAIALLSVIAYYFYVFIFVSNYKVCALIQGVLVISSFFDISWFYFGIEKFKLTVFWSTVMKVIMTIGVFIFVQTKQDLWIYVTIMASGTCLSQLILWFFLNKYVKITKVTLRGIKKHIKPMFILFIPLIAVSIYKYLDKIMLGMISSKAQVGFFENAERAINIPISVIGSFGTVMLPKMSYLAARGDENRGEKYIMKSMEFIMCLSTAIAFGLAAVADNFAIVFWGKEFSLCGILIELLSISIIFLAFANVIRMQYLIPKGKNVIYLISVILGAGINVTINIFAIPRMGAIGASIGTIFAEATVCIVQAFAIRKELPVITYIKNSVFFITTGFFMYIVVYFVKFFIGYGALELIIQIMVGGLFYCLICLIYFLKRKNEFVLSMIKLILKRNRNAYESQ